MNLVEQIQQHKIVAVIRKADVNNIVPILNALYEGGVYSVEITAETPNVLQVIDTAVKQVGDKINIGAGTVLDPETARSVIMAGAKFIVSPTLNLETLKLTNRYGILNIPGVLTPTEILTAYESGAQMVKIFPADAFGPNYVKNILGPLPHVKAMVTGGITLENINEYLSKGSTAVGIGSNLVNAKQLKTDEDYLHLIQTARAYVEKVNELER
ncbi:bifunctional 4-hydroxy-2-oxoglutarate aldolase/2-dehydro-3-deoxy-phosphogluconate aldolase [Oceanobacillus profundus]|uniref:Bifunctional 4-hydroxy-2-oxoglutarate aldolase/2-dehydro-3-deoxy-phosphogluconate aldolase n=1 Tax=Oceanobacillus profundus TaxID=372463 RepID=A0A417YPF8_9BACI|nr:bifunctional 4-hydroxy-2-oxoglutarate aldolase/2-dehydro-3-deoxy-phosphogluconate aldolase [Oceanobacillus profundus]MBR3118233.1 bifunctional 4-hydroxy-2-oxoglutarate aldolase/2-dehydro-3-deoxy-phosphogluconate aldolase [Oceanobacillus sp.]PAE30448.1 2-dehydro-3-deoxyphosphogluconate aldolase [Paenibacillus sp. 7884-2]MCM3399906.1 bifunctional 4-hydroxy-2-oxoglutarate aldolase/2-dehydro-3-deoxy-phosphogluconate aldolase [Oceanobacillus profundus]MDO6451206.1 bifunctional 4-hydroxy-2-oxoglut